VPSSVDSPEREAVKTISPETAPDAVEDDGGAESEPAEITDEAKAPVFPDDEMVFVVSESHSLQTPK
jgi:hypothetical protein